MFKPTIAVLAGAFVIAQTLSAQAPRPEIETVAAFARLYGVLRYFYPSDAAATLDWNRFAVHGVGQTRTATDGARLATVLKELVAPLGPGIEIAPSLPPASDPGSTGERLVAWRYLGAGIVPAGPMSPYRGKRTNRAIPIAAGIDGFVSMMQTVPAEALRGKTIRLRGQVRAAARVPGGAALWLRVDRSNQQAGFFDNMENRPIREPEWREYVIEGAVAADATNVAFGAMAFGEVTADFDAIELSVREADGSWTPVTIRDPGFEAGVTPASKDWTRVGTSTNAEIATPEEAPPQGLRFLRLSPPSASSVSGELFATLPTAGSHVDVDLGLGLNARVPLTLTDSRASAEAPGLGPLRVALEKIPASPDTSDVNVRLADVVVAWNVFRHFYPYWAEAGVDWDARLRPRLEGASDAASREAHHESLQRLVADARDGHGSVTDTRRAPAARALLPVQIGVIGNQLVITASAVPEAPVGGVISMINGASTSTRLSTLTDLASGTTQWKERRAIREIASCPKDAAVRLAIDAGSGPREVELRCDAARAFAEQRPEPIVELSPGEWYVDLSRANAAQLTPALPALATASGVVFDLRGYPTDAGIALLPHLVDAPENDRWMHVARIVGPFGQFDGWESFGWNLKPATPRISGKVVFMTDGRAISYAESVMGYIADRKLGTIVGTTTAGTNGNVATFPVPGGFTIAFTGMRVTGHDGKTPFHLVGVKPDISMAPTIAGLRAGRDEVLERAVAVIRGK